MRGAGSIEHAFLDQKYRIAVRIAVEHGSAHTTAGARAGNEQTIDVFADQIRDQMSSEKCARPRFANDELTVLWFDHFGKLHRQALEIGPIHAAFSGIAEGRLEIGIARRIDDRNFGIAAGVEQLLNFRHRIPCDFSAAGRSEERRVGKECRSWWSPYHSKKKNKHTVQCS